MFVKDDISFILMHPKGNSQPKSWKAGGKTFLTITQFLSEIETNLKETKEVYALIVKSLLFEEIDKAVEVPEAIKPLLQEFQEIIPYELLGEVLCVIFNTKLTWY